jgi:hypothetical protein
MRATALPARTLEDRGDGALQSLVRVAGHQLDPAQTAGHQTAQERVPESAVFARSHVESKHFALAVSIDPNRDDNGHRHHPMGPGEL